METFIPFGLNFFDITMSGEISGERALPPSDASIPAFLGALGLLPNFEADTELQD
jgi:hypothetical protein